MTDQAADAKPSPLRVHGLFLVTTAFASGVVAAYPLAFRMSSFWMWTGILGFLVLPMAISVWRPLPSRLFLVLTIGMVLTCPAIYVLLDDWESGRDAYFLMTATNTVLVSTTWVIDSVHFRLWRDTIIAGVGMLFSMIAVWVILWMKIFFE